VTINLFHGDCLEVMATMEDNSIDSIVCDPPAGISFMGKKWDGDKGGRNAWIAWMASIAAECLRVLKPGGHAFVWALPRTSHWTATAWEDAGFEVRDRVAHVFGSGFPKSLDVSKAIDKAAGATREVIGPDPEAARRNKTTSKFGSIYGEIDDAESVPLTAPATAEAAQWDGWGTALKPAMEDWWLFRKPLAERTVAANVLRWGTGAINVDKCRVRPEVQQPADGAYTRLSFPDSVPDISPDSLSVVLDSLRHIASGLRSCSSDSTSLLRDVAGQDGTLQKGAVYDEILQRLYPNGSWCGLTLSVVPNSQDGCQSCHRLCGELLLRLQEAAQVSATSLADALEHTCSVLSESEHTHGCLCIDRPSSWGVLRLSWSLVHFLSGNTIPRLAHPRKLANRTSDKFSGRYNGGESGHYRGKEEFADGTTHQGRWPANLILSYPEDEYDDEGNLLPNPGKDEVLAGFPVTTQASARPNSRGIVYSKDGAQIYGEYAPNGHNSMHGDTGSAARFFYVAKSSKRDRNEGCEGLEEKGKVFNGQSAQPAGNAAGSVEDKFSTQPAKNFHPCVKPTALMQYLCRLITPPGGLVLDPFMGSGSTGKGAILEGFRFIGIEQDAEYIEIARRRIEWAFQQAHPTTGEFVTKAGRAEDTDGLPMFGGEQ
jgi:DNA modification methylase